MAIHNIYEAKTKLSQLIKLALEGEDVLIAKNGRALVKLTPVASKPRELGGWEGKVWVADDFDELDSEIEQMFGIGDDN